MSSTVCSNALWFASKELHLLKKINDAVKCEIIASGGIRNQYDLDAIEAIGINEAIVGKAMYEGTIKLRGGAL